MGWLDKLRRKSPQQTQYAEMLNGFTPIFSQFGQDIYASDVVQQAVTCIVSEMKKLNPMHVRQIGSDVVPVNDDIQAILNTPNEIMTTSELIEKIIWQLFLNYNAFVIPTYYTWTDDKGNLRRHYTGLYPVQPIQVDFIQDLNDRMFVKMQFANNFETTLAYSDVIHIRRNYSINEFMGGNEEGQPDNDALLKTLELNHTLLEGVSNAMKASFAINGVVKYNTLMDDGKVEKNLEALEKKLKRSESGFLPLDLRNEFIPLSREVKLVDADTLKFVDEKILRHYGVPLKILTGEYSKEDYEAFYQKTLEPIIISLTQGFTRVLFSPRAQSFGNKVNFYPKNLIFMSVDQTLEMVRLLGDSGSLFENEKRVAFGLMPLAELEGKRMQSLNYVDVEIANKYQAGSDTDSEKNGGENDDGQDDKSNGNQEADESEGDETS